MIAICKNNKTILNIKNVCQNIYILDFEESDEYIDFTKFFYLQDNNIKYNVRKIVEKHFDLQHREWSLLEN